MPTEFVRMDSYRHAEYHRKRELRQFIPRISLFLAVCGASLWLIHQDLNQDNPKFLPRAEPAEILYPGIQ